MQLKNITPQNPIETQILEYLKRFDTPITKEVIQGIKDDIEDAILENQPYEFTENQLCEFLLKYK